MSHPANENYVEYIQETLEEMLAEQKDGLNLESHIDHSKSLLHLSFDLPTESLRDKISSIADEYILYIGDLYPFIFGEKRNYFEDEIINKLFKDYPDIDSFYQLYETIKAIKEHKKIT